MRLTGDRLCLFLVVILGGVATAFGQVQSEQDEQPAAAGPTADARDERRGERRGVRRLGDVLSESNGTDRVPDLPGIPGAADPEAEPDPEPASEEDAAGAQEVRELLAKANLALEHGRITEPQGDNAREYFEKALRIDPENSVAIEGIEEVERRLCFTGMGDKIRPC